MAIPVEPDLGELRQYTLPQLNHYLCVSSVECYGCIYCQRPPNFFHWLATSRNHRAKSSAPLPGGPCPLYATIFRVANKEWTENKSQRRECKFVQALYAWKPKLFNNCDERTLRCTLLAVVLFLQNARNPLEISTGD